MELQLATPCPFTTSFDMSRTPLMIYCMFYFHFSLRPFPGDSGLANRSGAGASNDVWRLHIEPSLHASLDDYDGVLLDLLHDHRPLFHPAQCSCHSHRWQLVQWRALCFGRCGLFLHTRVFIGASPHPPVDSHTDLGPPPAPRLPRVLISRRLFLLPMDHLPIPRGSSGGASG